MQTLNFPACNFRIRESEQRLEIFDIIRKRFVALTPEEWVRQHLIHFMHFEKNVPLYMMAVERGIRVNSLLRRFDLLVFATGGKPVMIAECKAPAVALSEETLFQASAYNMALKVEYLLITNGLDHYCAKVSYEKNSLDFLSGIPDYQSLSGGPVQ